MAEEGQDFGTRTVLELFVRGERGCRIGEGTLGVHVVKIAKFSQRQEEK